MFGSAVDRGLSTIVLKVADMATALATLADRGIQATSHTILEPNGEKRIELALLPDLPDAAANLRLIQYYKTGAERHAEDFGGRQHATPLKRLDHLAAVAPDLERSCTFWDEVLGVPTVGEVISPTIVVRQLKIGDAMFELLGPATPDSPIRQRPPGLNSMCSFEVPDLDATIAHARAAGFEMADRRIGTLPGHHRGDHPRRPDQRAERPASPVRVASSPAPLSHRDGEGKPLRSAPPLPAGGGAWGWGLFKEELSYDRVRRAHRSGPYRADRLRRLQAHPHPGRPGRPRADAARPRILGRADRRLPRAEIPIIYTTPVSRADGADVVHAADRPERRDRARRR